MRQKTLAIMYGIRHRKTGAVMPLAQTGRGYTYWEPGETNSFRTVPGSPPRLFSSRAAAQRAIGHWAKGVAQVAWETDPEGWHSEPAGVDYMDIGRKPSDLEVFKVRVIEEIEE